MSPWDDTLSIEYAMLCEILGEPRQGKCAGGYILGWGPSTHAKKDGAPRENHLTIAYAPDGDRSGPWVIGTPDPAVYAHTFDGVIKLITDPAWQKENLFWKTVE